MAQIWAIFFVIFINMLGFGVIIPLAPTFKDSLNLTSFEYGLMGAIFPLAQMFAAPILGRISDRVGRRPVMIVSFIFVSFSYIILAFTHNYITLLISRIVGGFFSGSFVVAMACAADISTPETRRKYIGIAGMGFGFGFMLGPTVGGLLAGYNPLHANVVLTAISALCLSILGIIVIIVALPETLKTLHVVETSIFQEIRTIFKKSQDIVNFFLSAVLSMVLAGLEVFLSLWIFKAFQFSPLDIGIFWGVYAVVMNIGRIALLKFMKGYKDMALSFLALCIAIIGYIFTVHLAILYFWTCVIALFSGALITLINSSISLNADPNQQGLFLGLSNAAGNIGRFIAPTIMGFIVQKSHSNSSGWIFLVIMCMLAVYGSYFIYKKQKTDPSIL